MNYNDDQNEKQVEDYKPEQNKFLFDIFLMVTNKNNNICLELRKSTSNKEIMRQIISAAYNKKPIIIYPRFRDEYKAIVKLIQTDILYYDSEEGIYYFKI
jgi:FtsZ-interacting cell division protein YlmF